MSRLRRWLNDLRTRLAAVIAVPVGKPNDGLTKYYSGSELDRPWGVLHADLMNAQEAWQRNPMVKRVVGMITAYVVGPGIELTSERAQFKSFIERFWNHPENRMLLRVPEWCDELVVSGEIFPVLFTNPHDGMSYVRLIPASLIEEVDFSPDDYERELRYRETSAPGEKEKWWISPKHPDANKKRADGSLAPWMLHYAVNRAPGHVRGESDLRTLLPWALRYESWLQDRVRLNVGMRSFYYVVYAARNLKNQLSKIYQTPPPTGSVIVAEKDAEQWDTITPQLNSRDAKEDGRAIRWMIAAGGPGMTLADFGEGEDSGLQKGAETNEQRRRFLLRRQRFFSWMLADLVIHAFDRYRLSGVTRDYATMTYSDVVVHAPDIAAEDNELLAGAASTVTTALTGMQAMVGSTEEYRRFALRLFIKHLGESVSEKEFEAMLEGDPLADAENQLKIAQKYAPSPAANSSQGGSKKEGGQ